MCFRTLVVKIKRIPIPYEIFGKVSINLKKVDPRFVGVHIGAITVSTDTVQQLCHSSNLQLQKSAPCTDIHGTQGSQVQILYHTLVPWY